MIEIDGFYWFVGALLICVVHVIYLRGWRREQRQILALREKYNAREQKRHDEPMQAFACNDSAVGWNLDGSRERGQA